MDRLIGGARRDICQPGTRLRRLRASQIVSGDRHSFWAGYATSELPPGKFDPIGLSFVGRRCRFRAPAPWKPTSIRFPKGRSASSVIPLSIDRPGGGKPDWTFNMLLKHGVWSCLEYAKSFVPETRPCRFRTRTLPHTSSSSTIGGHGYATVRLGADENANRVCLHSAADHAQ